ncbi:hypothetical protein [Janibacter sp. GS2]|uniref:hypothetical protein n=1 Tax=Janibacter sp. GS2 TaxID=3442646 RepID=UPI003EB86C2E
MENITMIPTAIDAALASSSDVFGDATGVFVRRDRTQVIDPKTASVSDPRPAGPFV